MTGRLISGTSKTYARRGVIWYHVARAVDEDVRPVALLVYDASVLAVIVRPGRRRAASETLDAAEGSVLRSCLLATHAVWPTIDLHKPG